MAQAPETAGTVTLTWDGKDDLGRPVINNGTYTWKALEQPGQHRRSRRGGRFSIQSPMTPLKTWVTRSMNLAVNQIGGTSGEVGGTFAQNDGESYIGDTSLSQNYTLETPITASGTLFFTDVATMEGKAFLGHFSQSTATNRREFIGLEFEKGADSEHRTIGVRARIYRFNGDFSSDAISNTIDLGINTGYYNWTYSYDPTYEAGINDGSGGSHSGPEGRLTVHIFNNAGARFTLYAVNDGTHRDAGSTFDAFGMGIATGEITARRQCRQDRQDLHG